MPSFSLITEPSLASSTASVSPSACFFRNFLRPGVRGGGRGEGACEQGLVSGAAGLDASSAAASSGVASRARLLRLAPPLLSHAFRTLADLRVDQAGGRLQRLGRVLEAAERLELDNLLGGRKSGGTRRRRLRGDATPSGSGDMLSAGCVPSLSAGAHTHLGGLLGRLEVGPHILQRVNQQQRAPR